SPLLLFVRFDFNQLHVRNRDAPSVATFLDLREEAQTGTNAIEITAANQSAADAIAQRLSALPQVAQTRTLDSLVPGDHEQKVKLIQAAADQIGVCSVRSRSPRPPRMRRSSKPCLRLPTSCRPPPTIARDLAPTRRGASPDCCCSWRGRIPASVRGSRPR